MLQLLDLVEVMDEGLRDLLNKKWAISNLVLNLLLGALESLRVLAHVLGSEGLGELAGALKSSLVADEGGRALNSLLQAILLNESLDLLLEL